MAWPASTHKGWPNKKKASTGPAKSTGNTVVKKHIKKQHVEHNKGMQVSKPVTGSAPASQLSVMPNTTQR